VYPDSVMVHGKTLVLSVALLAACHDPSNGGASRSAGADEGVPATPAASGDATANDATAQAAPQVALVADGGPTFEVDASQQRASSPEMGFVLQLNDEWDVASETPTEGVGVSATHKASLANCHVTLALLGGRTVKDVVDSVRLKQPDTPIPIQEVVFEAELGSAPATVKRLTNAKEGTHYKGTLEFRFAKHGENLAAAYCVYTPLPTGFRPEGTAGAMPTADLTAGPKAVAAFFDAITLPAK
jgi:hypothetical protein